MTKQVALQPEKETTKIWNDANSGDVFLYQGEIYELIEKNILPDNICDINFRLLNKMVLEMQLQESWAKRDIGSTVIYDFQAYKVLHIIKTDDIHCTIALELIEEEVALAEVKKPESIDGTFIGEIPF